MLPSDSTQSSGTPTPSDDNSFKRKLINICILVLMIACEVADHYHLTDLAEACKQIKWLLDLIALVLVL
jgi:hypothetical protein